MLKLEVFSPLHTQGVLDIYSGIVRNTHISFEYEVPTFEDMKMRVEKNLQKYPWLVAEIGGKVAGYAYASQLRYRRAYDWSAELSIYLHSDFYGMGFARALYGGLFDILKLQNVQTAFGVIALPNVASERFHDKMGFRKTGELPRVGYKFNSWHSTAYYVKHIGEEEVPGEFVYFPELAKEKVAGVLQKYSLGV